MRITKAVFDYMQDLEGNNYLINLKYIKFEIPLTQNIPMSEKKSLDEFTCSGININFFYQKNEFFYQKNVFFYQKNIFFFIKSLL